jgi:hypothetical protein
MLFALPSGHGRVASTRQGSLEEPMPKAEEVEVGRVENPFDGLNEEPTDLKGMSLYVWL